MSELHKQVCVCVCACACSCLIAEQNLQVAAWWPDGGLLTSPHKDAILLETHTHEEEDGFWLPATLEFIQDTEFRCLNTTIIRKNNGRERRAVNGKGPRALELNALRVKMKSWLIRDRRDHLLVSDCTLPGPTGARTDIYENAVFNPSIYKKK